MSVGGGLDLCACKRGFFTLRDCANPATDELHDLHAAHLPRAPRARRRPVRRVRRQARRGTRDVDSPTRVDAPDGAGAVRYRRRSWY